MIPWNLSQGSHLASDEELTYVWSVYTPKDFYYAIHYDNRVNRSIIYITPILYWKQYAALIDESMAILDIIPHDFEEVSEATYECGRSKNDVKLDLEKRGFIWSDGFHNEMTRYYAIHGKLE